ncbi:hypothetical protein [Flavobacterium sp.]|uniref:hypothetical protein n=1 Tax=Flavobacterium sp. TaxID=239 RepID=UPI00286EB104|nr:hypothetical protein [Flavobacterium sp.]
MENKENESELDKLNHGEPIERLDQQKLQADWRAEIEMNQDAQEYFKAYSKKSVQSFLDDYVRNKYRWVRYGDYYKQRNEKSNEHLIYRAHEHLQIILQKKLFDLQCLWRAEQIALEGVEICYDFQIWGKDILDCPFLEPITPEDVALYSDFLMRTDSDLRYYYEEQNWQDYTNFKKEYYKINDGIMMPDWYEFHNLRTGNFSLMLLEDIRGDKEKFYNSMYYNSQEQLDARAKITEERENDPDYDSRPYLGCYDDDGTLYFVKTFENKAIQSKYKNYQEYSPDAPENQKNERYINILKELLDEEEPIAIAANSDFREALEKTLDGFKREKIVEYLPQAVEHYMFNKKMGFLMSSKDNYYLGLRTYIVERLKKAREMNGEAPDLYF